MAHKNGESGDGIGEKKENPLLDRARGFGKLFEYLRKISFRKKLFVIVAFVVTSVLIPVAKDLMKEKAHTFLEKKSDDSVGSKPNSDLGNYSSNFYFIDIKRVTREWHFKEPEAKTNFHYVQNGYLNMFKPSGITNLDIKAISQFGFDGQWTVTVLAKHFGTGTVSFGLRVYTENGWVAIYLTTVGAAGRNNFMHQVYASWEANQRSDFGNGTPFPGDEVWLQIKNTGSTLEAWFQDPEHMAFGWQLLRRVPDLHGKARAELFLLQESPTNVDANLEDRVGFSKMSIIGTSGSITNLPIHF